jgi:hypothetical protein
MSFPVDQKSRIGLKQARRWLAAMSISSVDFKAITMKFGDSYPRL